MLSPILKEDQMIKTYRCIYTEYKIVVKPAIHGPEEKGGRKGEYIQFHDGLFKTANKEYQRIIEKNLIFGSMIFIDREEPEIEVAKETKEETENTQENESEESEEDQEQEKDSDSENPKAKKKRGNPNFVKKTQE